MAHLKNCIFFHNSNQFLGSGHHVYGSPRFERGSYESQGVVESKKVRIKKIGATPIDRYKQKCNFVNKCNNSGTTHLSKKFFSAKMFTMNRGSRQYEAEC